MRLQVGDEQDVSDRGIRGKAVYLREPCLEDEAEYIAMLEESREFHLPWIVSPTAPQDFRAYLERIQGDRHRGYFVCEGTSGKLAGIFNLNEIVRGSFQSAYLGYSVHVRFARRGFMKEGLRLLLHHARDQLGLHRLEANIQPGNEASRRLVQGCGFRLEGYSPRYLKILGEWRDHERWAILLDDPGEAIE